MFVDEGDLEGFFLAVAEEFDGDGVAGGDVAFDEVGDRHEAVFRVVVVAAGVDRVAVDLEDDIAVLDAGVFGRGVREDGGDEDAAGAVAELGELAQLLVEGL